MDYYKHITEIEQVVAGFESCGTAKAEFTHQRHVTVAVFYIQTFGEFEATQKMRDGLHRFLDYHRVGRVKFHETLTIFWVRMVAALLRSLDPSASLLESTNRAVEELGDSRLVFEYYSEERLRTDEARNCWLEPDLKQL